jgi:hypothetical protein
MKFFTHHTFFALLVVLLSASALPLDAIYAQRRGGGNRGSGNINRAGASPRVNSNVNLQNRGNINRPNVNTSNINRGNINRGNINTGNINRGNINVGNSVNVNTGWRGGGWYGGGYRTPPGWGLATFATGLAIGATINNRPPYYNTVVVGGNNFIYSDGVFLQPRGSSYVVIAPPVGAVVPSIPEGCSVTNQGGVIYYDCSGVIYQPFYQGSDLVYRVVRF